MSTWVPHFRMNIEPLSSLNEILPVLTGCNLPVADILAASPPQFFGIRVTGVLVAVVGLELFQSTGLLHSPAFRGRGLAQELVAFAEAFAAAHGARSLCPPRVAANWHPILRSKFKDRLTSVMVSSHAKGPEGPFLQHDYVATDPHFMAARLTAFVGAAALGAALAATFAFGAAGSGAAGAALSAVR
ncbi:MAG TPA: GNAT family N-acetyltransferase [Rhodoferax sp.]